MSDTAAESETARPAAVASVHLSATVQLKVPPHSVEAEQSVHGGLMLNNDAWLNVSDILTARDFYRAMGFHDTAYIPGYYRGVETALRMSRDIRRYIPDRIS